SGWLLSGIGRVPTPDAVYHAGLLHLCREAPQETGGAVCATRLFGNYSRNTGVYVPVYRHLVRHFFGRFFDTESLSPQGDPQAGVIQILGILAVPGAFFVLLFRPLDLWDWSLVSVRYMFVLYSMVVMGFVMVFEWDALFLDARGCQILTPVPIRRRTLLFTKAVALGMFLALFLADINFF